MALSGKQGDGLSSQGRGSEGNDPWWAMAATQLVSAVDKHGDDKAGKKPLAKAARKPVATSDSTKQPSPEADGERQDAFVPLAPNSFGEIGLRENEIEALILKFLLNQGAATGREIAEQIKLPFGLLANLLRQSKEEQLVVYKGAAPLSDYHYELTEAGCQRARRYSGQSTYFGAAPVTLDQYWAGIKAQSITKESPTLDDLCKAFTDLVLNRELLEQLGQAINSGLGLFLYGPPGNGKTSIAERVTGCLGESMWIPRAISVLGELIQVYDPSNHRALPTPEPGHLTDENRIDQRWIRIRRPTIVVGGELTMDNLELTANTAAGISEAPLQMKANGGVLLIDDFGRQRISPAELLNRWIVPLEKRYDFLNLRSGRKIQVPFDQLIIFSTNLEPKNLVDEAFLRRIPYKIDVRDPTEAEFRDLLKRLAESMGIEYRQEAVDYLMAKHYSTTGRQMRFCQPRDLLHQMRIFCRFHGRPPAITREAVDAAVKNYFAMM